MPKITDHRLNNKTSRLDLPYRTNGKPYWMPVGVPGVWLGYRRRKTNIPGTWAVKSNHPKPWTDSIGAASDYLEDESKADGKHVLNFTQAFKRARDDGFHKPMGPGGGGGGKPMTVGAEGDENSMLARYKDQLINDSGDLENLSRLERYMSDDFKNMHVVSLTSGDLIQWQKDCLKQCTRSTTTRIRKNLCAALRVASRFDSRINPRIWSTDNFPSCGEGGRVEDDDVHETSRNVFLEDPNDLYTFVDGAYEEDERFGLYCEVLNETGCRPSQAARLRVIDLLLTKQLNMWLSAKGKSTKRREKRKKQVPVPISDQLYAKLRAAARGRKPDDWLLLHRDGKPWHWVRDRWVKNKKTGEKVFKPAGPHGSCANRYRPFVEAVVKKTGLTSPFGKVTMYCLRHTNISNRVLDRVSDNIIGDALDTSARMVKKYYTDKLIHSGRAQDLLRASLPQRPAPTQAPAPAQSKKVA